MNLIWMYVGRALFSIGLIARHLLHRPTHRVDAVVAVLVLPTCCLAGMDKPWQELESGSTGDTIEGLVLLAILAFAIHLIERGEFFGFLRDIAKGLSFIATMYLMGVWFLACIIGVAVTLQAFGMEKSTSGFIAFPTGLVVAFKLFEMYQDWRNPGPK